MKSLRMALAAAVLGASGATANAVTLSFDSQVTGSFNLTPNASEPFGFDLGEAFTVNFNIDSATNTAVANFATGNGDTFSENYVLNYDMIGTTLLATVPAYSSLGVLFFDNNSGQGNLSLDDFFSDLQSNGGTQLAGFGFGESANNLTIASGGNDVRVSGLNTLAPIPLGSSGVMLLTALGLVGGAVALSRATVKQRKATPA